MTEDIWSRAQLAIVNTRTLEDMAMVVRCRGIGKLARFGSSSQR